MPAETPTTPAPGATPSAAAPQAPTPAAPAAPAFEPGSPEFFRDALSKATPEETAAALAPALGGAAEQTAEQEPKDDARSETSPLLEQVPDAESAEDAIQTSAKYHKLAAAMDQIAKTEDAQAVWIDLWNDFALKDEQGNITGPHPAFQQLELAIWDANSREIVKASQGGNLHPVLANLLHDGLDAIYEAAKAGPSSADNSDLMAAIDVLREIRPRQSSRRAELTPEQKTAQARIDRDRAELDTRAGNERKATLDSALSTMQTEIDDALVDEIWPSLEAARLSAFAEENAVIEIENRLKGELGKDPLYMQRKARLAAAVRRAPTKENVAALKKHELSYGKMKIRKIAEDVLGKASAPGSRTTAVSGGPDSIEASQAEWEKIPGNAGTQMDLDWHFNRIMKARK